MHFRDAIPAAVAAAAAAALLSACSGAGSPVAPQAGQETGAQSLLHARAAGPISLADASSSVLGSRPADLSGLRFVDPATIKAQIYVGQYGVPSAPGEVNDYKAANTKNVKPFCSIADLTGVNAIAVDSTGELWIPQQTPAGVNEVTSNAPGCGKAGVTLSDPNGQPADIGFAASGIDYVSDIESNGSGAGDISIYPKGATSPSGTLTNKAVFFSLGVAVDSKGNVYESFIDSAQTGGGVIEYAGGKMPGKLVKGIKIAEPGTLIIDAKDNLITTDQTALTVDTYAPPYTKAPTTFPLKGKSIECSIDKAETDIACGDVANDSADVYKYPSGTYSYSFNTGLPSTLTTIGIAQDPTE
jgi:hypothetical protein